MAGQKGFLHLRAKKADWEKAKASDSPEAYLADLLTKGELRKIDTTSSFPSDAFKGGDIVLDMSSGKASIDGGNKVLEAFISIHCPDCLEETLTLQRNRLDNWNGKAPFIYQCSDDNCDGVCHASSNGSLKGVPANKKIREGRQHTTKLLQDITSKVFKNIIAPDLRKRGITEDSVEWKSAYQTCFGKTRRWFSHETGVKNIESETNLDALRNAYKIMKNTLIQSIHDWVPDNHENNSLPSP